MSHTITKTIEVTDAQLESVLTTAVEGGIGYWSVVTDCERRDDLSWVSVALEGTEETQEDFEPLTVRAVDLVPAIQKLMDGTIGLRSDLLAQIHSDEGIEYVDSDVADCIVQIAAFGEVVYG